MSEYLTVAGGCFSVRQVCCLFKVVNTRNNLRKVSEHLKLNVCELKVLCDGVSELLVSCQRSLVSAVGSVVQWSCQLPWMSETLWPLVRSLIWVLYFKGRRPPESTEKLPGKRSKCSVSVEQRVRSRFAKQLPRCGSPGSMPVIPRHLERNSHGSGWGGGPCPPPTPRDL